MPVSSSKRSRDPQVPPDADTATTYADIPHAPGSRAKRRSFHKPLLIVAFAAAVLVGVYYFVQYQRLRNDPTLEARREAEQVVKELSRLMIVPDEPAPILATVSDRDQLQDQPFFRNAQNGDQVVIFPASMRAVLYRPSEKRIVDIAPLMADAPPQPVPASEPDPLSSPAEAQNEPAPDELADPTPTGE